MGHKKIIKLSEREYWAELCDRADKKIKHYLKRVKEYKKKLSQYEHKLEKWYSKSRHRGHKYRSASNRFKMIHGG